MSKYELSYFPVRGRGQAIRYFLQDNDIAYEEKNVGPQWTDIKKTAIFGQAPFLQDGDFQIAQSCVILKYLGRKHGLYPTDAKEAAKVEMVCDFVEEVRGEYVRMIYQNYENGKDEFIKSLEKLKYLEKLFEKWSTNFITSQISAIDYNLLELLEILTILSSTCLDNFPKLKAFVARMQARPALAKYRGSEEFKNRPVNANGKQ